MLKPAKMQKVRIIALQNIVEKLIAMLHEEGFLEIRKVDHSGLESGRPLEFYNQISQELVKLRGVVALLEKHLSRMPAIGNEVISAEDAIKQSKSLDISVRLKTLNDEKTKLESECNAIHAQITDANRLLCFKGVDFSKLRTKLVNYYVGELPKSKIGALKAELEKITDHHDIICRENENNGNVVTLLFYTSKNDIEPLLTENGFRIIQLPQQFTVPEVTLGMLKKDCMEKEKRTEEINAELARIALESYSLIKVLIRSLEIAADRAEITSKFSFSKSTCVLEGWVEEENYVKLDNLIANFADKAVLNKMSFGHHDMPPTVLENPSQAGPFEFITKSYSLPNYYEIDPTMIYMLTVPLLLGMIVGDVIYGILMIVMSLWLMKKFRKSYIMSNVSKIWYYSSFTTILFGLIFDEWLGFHHKQIFELLVVWGLPVSTAPLYVGLSRIHSLSLLIGITVLVGLVHLGIGFILGAINEFGHSKKHAAAKIAWLGVEIGGTIAVASLVLNLLPLSYGNAGMILLGMSAFILAITEGFIGLLEIPGLMGNALSYARIAAIGVVGVVLAEIINEYFAPTPSAGLFLIITIPLFLIFHFVNMFVAMFEALIQGGRLNLIEFRSKFLKGGGSVFAPFSMKNNEKIMR